LAQQCCWAVPELLPNRVRHVALVITGTSLCHRQLEYLTKSPEISTWTCVTLGPVAARLALHAGTGVKFPTSPSHVCVNTNFSKWRWLFYGPAIGSGLNTLIIYWIYFPPKHPRGIHWDKAVRILDYIGALLFATGCILVLLGVVYTNIVPASSPRVIVLLCVGFATIVGFALWERLVPLEAPLCPPKIFAKHWGREFTFPLVAATIINMFYYSTNVAYITQASFSHIARCEKF